MAVDLALGLRDILDASAELASAEDEDAVLHIAIRRARQLVGTDLAYVMLLDPERGDTYMRMAEGATSPRFDTIRLGMGLGLGGQVAEAMAPRWTRNYLADEQYTHVIDPIIRDEGVKAILGVPVRTHGRLTGTLFTSDRRERAFSQDEITLVALLADQVSAALTAAERASRRQRDLDSTRDALDIAHAETARLSATVDLHERLTRLVIAGTTVPEIVDLVVDLEGGTAAVFDLAHRDIGSARSPEGPPADLLRQVLAEVGTDSERSTSAVTRSVDGHLVVVTPVVTGPDHLGYVTFASRGSVPAIRPVLARVSSVIALILLGHRARDEADNRVRGELLAEVLAPGEHDLDAIARRAALLGVDVDADLVALVITPDGARMTRALETECRSLARADDGLVTTYGDRGVMLLPGTDAGATARDVAARLAAHRATVGASGPIAGLAGLAVVAGAGGLGDHVERAGRAARLLIALDRAGDGAATDELGLYGLLFSEVDRETVTQLIERNLGPVRDFDRTRGTALLETLEAWFGADGSPSATAERLFVHVNTVYQRLDRLDQVLGTGWRRGDRALELRLALRLAELRRA
ncbi:helix-turn-helix domain-containing protein [Dietzia sp. SL131]|uniref:helix-turn-helix domain-containing protein n=1 Tax=Dietzia sp. SL131 TaxID=2995149 RepID=UPI00227C9AB0|nr:helix-turn-helix domain-containing protein [Dietzia sp. SL131]MCY1658021.1 helix-turn-helix domain-containing protein [Dietzia sp. SL131]